jgi:hypothetical protein
MSRRLYVPYHQRLFVICSRQVKELVSRNDQKKNKNQSLDFWSQLRLMQKNDIVHSLIIIVAYLWLKMYILCFDYRLAAGELFSHRVKAMLQIL